ncbi:uncharacterized protein LOC113355827 [Papaver somniferum]|uniref:uncharacterized protein LOC113355827 n=1 Tax=Papaver somniferum TaxID=3469 RepID=UPI000E6F57D3|nr:uncharacterized protein LOC113355827 [Papaver somniferum]
MENPNWTEVQEALYPHQTATDRPDLVARVFEMKRKALMDEIVEKKVFGDVVGYVYTIEFQKRGSPHMHALIYLEKSQIQLTRNKDSPCMKKENCTKHYPKSYNDTTCLDGGGYSVYRRRNNGVEVDVHGGHKATNIDIVPYNPHLLRMFNCHINVEEIPHMERLAIHLKGMQRIVYESEASTEGVTQIAENYKSKLMAYFEYYDENPDAPAYTYQDFLQHMVWKKDISK